MLNLTVSVVRQAILQPHSLRFISRCGCIVSCDCTCNYRRCTPAKVSHRDQPTSSVSVTSATRPTGKATFTSPCERRCGGLWHLQVQREFHTTAHLQGSSNDDTEEAGYREDILDSEEDQLFLREICNIPDSGHKVFVIQPDAKVKKKPLSSADLRLAETCALVETLQRWRVVDKMVVRTKCPESQWVFGSGNSAMLREILRDHRGISAVVMGVDLLKKGQLDTLEADWGLPVLDRYAVVLQIFKARAKTKEAKVQVALAEIPFLRSRLHHVGGTASQVSTGESSVSPARLLLSREGKLRKLLSKLKSQRSLLRKSRQRQQIPSVAVVGYTNAGKTTLIKALTGDASMRPKDQLFATLDVTAHGGKLPNRMAITFIDTVGFIADIPISLIEAFAATLEDALIADVIVHIRDISHPDAVGQKENVLQTLKSMLPAEKMSRIIEVCNKADKLQEPVPEGQGLLVSAVTGQGMADLRATIQHAVVSASGRLHKTFRIPAAGPHLSWLYKHATVMDCQLEGESQNFLVSVLISQAAYGKFKAYFRQPPTKAS